MAVLQRIATPFAGCLENRFSFRSLGDPLGSVTRIRKEQAFSQQ